jgi:two-component system sensor histidine kinase PilS (NtrC family)
MFEPFFSTRSRGSGLGLYICKELCERHGATIHLLQRSPDALHRTAFEIRLQRPWAAPGGGVAA